MVLYVRIRTDLSLSVHFCTQSATVTFTDGGDDFGVFIPLFASHGAPAQVLVIIVSFLAMTGIWCAFGYYIAKRSFLADRLGRLGRLLFPLALIGVGLFVLIDLFA